MKLLQKARGLRIWTRLAGNRGTPLCRDALHALERFLEQIPGADEREPQIVLSARTERSAGNSGNAGFFKEQLLQFFGRKAGVFNVYPGVERAVRRLTAKSRDARETGDKLIPPL